MRKVGWLFVLLYASLSMAAKDIAVVGIEYLTPDADSRLMIRHGGVALEVGEAVQLVDKRGGPTKFDAIVVRLVGKNNVIVEVVESGEE